MKQKVAGIYLIVFGVLCLLCALCMMAYSEYTSLQIEWDIEQGLRDSVFVVAREEVPSEQPTVAPTENVSFEEVISTVSEDQEIEEVVTYKNVLDIPKIECTAYICADTSAYSLHRGVGHHPETKPVGATGNCVIAGHASTTYRCIFNRLEEMQLFDEFFAYDANGTKHTYTVIERFVSSPYNLSILDDIDDGRSTITIYTCTEGGTMRFVLRGTEFTGNGLEEFKEQHFSTDINHLKSLNTNIHVEELSTLVGMRSTKRMMWSEELANVSLRPWLDGDMAYDDNEFINFGIFGNQGVVENDVTQD